MDDAFIIMQIGDTEMDRICDDVIVPAIRNCGLAPRRVDRDNTGDLLKAEIIAFLEGSQIIVADLTNERPNCYLEVGYAMGLGKKANLILTVREDHHHRSPNYRTDGPRVHFDLEGYDLLLWDPKNPKAFHDELMKRIKRRQAILAPPIPGEPDKTPRSRRPSTDEEWLAEQRQAALAGLKTLELPGYMEASASILPSGDWRQREILTAIEASQIKTFGWPIGIVINREKWTPQPTSLGVRAEVAVPGGQGIHERGSYDYWYMRRDGEFYLLQSLFEDERQPGALFFDTRIVRVTELLLFLARFYSRMNIADSAQIHLELAHGGLKDRQLLSADPMRMMSVGRITQENVVAAEIDCTISQLQTDLVDLVKQLLDPLFMVFGFFEVSEGVLTAIVDRFVAGGV